MKFEPIPQVFSWEPVRCYDTVDVGWSRLSDLNIHEGKLLGCSYNQSCVGVWVVDISVCFYHPTSFPILCCDIFSCAGKI